MVQSIRRMLWGGFAALVLLVVFGLVANIIIINAERRREFVVVQGSQPLLDKVRTMDDSIDTMVAASRGYMLTHDSKFEQQYDDAIQQFKSAAGSASQLADDRDQHALSQFSTYFEELRQLTDEQISRAKHGETDLDALLKVASRRRSATDYAGALIDRHRREQDREGDSLTSMRQSIVLGLIIASVLVLLAVAFGLQRIEAAMVESITRQVRRTEAMVAGMSDGVMLVDADGRTVFINPAGEQLVGNATGVPIFKHADVYGFRDKDGRPIDAKELPAAQALATGYAVHDATMLITRGDREVAVSMSATPLQEDGRVTGVVVTFRDITERRRLEQEMQAQAERAQTLADAGAFFASNIDPGWVTQAIAERVAEVLGDWAAVILRTDKTTNELSVASIYHRDMASLGLAWSYLYRQPLVVGEGLIGQVVATGYPSLTSNVGGIARGEAYKVAMAASATPMQLASLLILPLRTRREMLGALIVAANDPDRTMTDEKLPLAEVLAERAALAIENSKLYTEQVEARRKVEDLSRLKDEFLSIASHELRTPVTSIKGYTQLAKTLIREGDLGTSEEYLDIALDQIDRMSRLILELLDVSRIETGRLEIRRESIPWTTFVRDVVHRHHTAVSDRRFHLNITDSKKVVNGDRDRLEQVLGNLLENAVKYSPDGSEIFVSVEDKGDLLLTSVCDRGIGIPSDEIAQVFERFHRGRQVSSTNYGGLGLGLYITKQIIERHGGAIWVESKEGAGTTFYFTLPAEVVEAPVAQAQAASRS